MSVSPLEPQGDLKQDQRLARKMVSYSKAIDELECSRTQGNTRQPSRTQFLKFMTFAKAELS